MINFLTLVMIDLVAGLGLLFYFLAIGLDTVYLSPKTVPLAKVQNGV